MSASPALPSRQGRNAVTRADVARYAGVSTAVVTYVINQGPRPVAPATAQRVRQAIELLGYQPNASARALSTGTTGMLGLVVPAITNPLFAEIAQAVEKAAADKGFSVILADSGQDPAAERRHISSLIARQVDGLIVMTTQLRADLPSMSLKGTPTVVLNALDAVPGAYSIGVDAFGGAYRAVQHLLDHGYGSVGLIIGDHTGTGLEPRERGWIKALRDAGVNEGPVARHPFTRRGGLDAGREIVERTNPPRSIFCSSDLQALGLLHALWQRRVRVPDDVAVMSFDGVEDSAFSNPSLSVVQQPIADMALQGVKQVLRQVAGEVLADHHEAYYTTLKLRDSCGKH